MFEIILRAVAGQRSPRKLPLQKNRGAHLQQHGGLQSAAPGWVRALMALMCRFRSGAMLILKFRYTATLSLESELTGDRSANNAWMQTKFALHYQNLRADDARPGSRSAA